MSEAFKAERSLKSQAISHFGAGSPIKELALVAERINAHLIVVARKDLLERITRIHNLESHLNV